MCGEESALMNSIEGRRGEARFRPPFPPTSGLFGKPTVINNVETLMNIPAIIEKGAAWFASIGTPAEHGDEGLLRERRRRRTRASMSWSWGATLKDLLDLAGAEDVKMVQIGGATGGDRPCLHDRDAALLRDGPSAPAPLRL